MKGIDIDTPKERWIWLPYQHQLQELCLRKYSNWLQAYNNFNWWLEDIEEFVVLGRPFKTLEQLWLAFVMHEKYNKTWNEEEWVNG
ncbi:MAG: hypothetical protein GY782_08580 [Gammaproteobacteria bacterium]|nr:hypothetical protein [Gammaproteobacteria bacterium]